MIIVSQDKDTIINFDNIGILGILGIGNPLEDDDRKFKILANTISDSQYILAKYDTEERAKEVLEQILGKYKECNRFGAEGIGFVANNIFYMPKE